MNRSYQIVSESAKELLLVNPAFGYLAKYVWLFNNKIRTKKILKKYPTPEDLYEKLVTVNDPGIRQIALECKNIDPEVYPAWVSIRFNPSKKSCHKVLGIILGIPNIVYQSLRAGVNSVRGADSVINKSIDQGRIYNTAGDMA